MKPIIYIQQSNLQELLQISSFFHRGIGFNWEEEGVVHAFTQYPAIALSGKPLLVIFKKLSPEELLEDPQSLLRQIEMKLCAEQNMPVDSFVCIFFQGVSAFGYIKADELFIDATVIPIVDGLNKPNSRLHDKKVLIVGANTIGIQICKELVIAGIENFSLIDSEKVDDENPDALCDAGRLKTQVATDCILKYNPKAKIEKFAMDIEEESGAFEQICQNADIIIYLDDNTIGRISINMIGLAFQKSIIFGRLIKEGGGIEVFHAKGYDLNTPCIACAMSTGMVFQDIEVPNSDTLSSFRFDSQIENAIAASYISWITLNELMGIHSRDELTQDYAFWAMEDNQSLLTRLMLWSQIYPNDNSPKKLRWLNFSLPKFPNCPVCSGSS